MMSNRLTEVTLCHFPVGSQSLKEGDEAGADEAEVSQEGYDVLQRRVDVVDVFQQLDFSFLEVGAAVRITMPQDAETIGLQNSHFSCSTVIIYI